LLDKIAIIGRLIGKRRTHIRRHRAASAPKSEANPGFPLVAIGSSTGGPTALSRVLAGLTRTDAAVTIVQHVDEMFAPGLASWLARESGREVRVIRTRDKPEPSIVHVASTNDHVLLTPELTFMYTNDPVDYCYRPSVDVFFHSVVNSWPGTAVGVLLTGMGEDGAKGLLAMRAAGWHTIAQDRATSIAYGMPKAAAKLNAAVEVLPLEEIAGAIARALPAVSSFQQRSCT
jgi:two-component system response regulator WspF